MVASSCSSTFRPFWLGRRAPTGSTPDGAPPGAANPRSISKVLLTRRLTTRSKRVRARQPGTGLITESDAEPEAVTRPDRRLRARFDADVEAHYRTQISRFRADLRAAGGDGFVEPDLVGEAACLTRPRNVVRDSTSDRRACSSVSPSRQWLRSLAVLVGERLELCPFRDEVGDQHGCCSGTRDRQPTGRWSQTGCGRSGAIRGTFCR